MLPIARWRHQHEVAPTAESGKSQNGTKLKKVGKVGKYNFSFLEIWVSELFNDTRRGLPLRSMK